MIKPGQVPRDKSARSLLQLPRHAYRAILADPPWHFQSWGRETSQHRRRDPERYYSTMRLADIAALPVHELAAPDAHLFLWTTGPFLPLACKVMEAWGFKHSGTAFTWVKLKRGYDTAQLRFLPIVDADLHVGLGYTTRKNTEPCPLGRRGNPKRKARDVREVILAPVREHSRKPSETRKRIERYCDGPYLELFAREMCPGWDSWGDQLGAFENAADCA